MTTQAMAIARKRVSAHEPATAAHPATTFPAGGSLRIAGYASLFGVADLSRDVVEAGAFAAALSKRGAGGIRMLFQHDPARPVGVWTSLREDARGLAVQGRLTDGAAGALAALILDGAVDGLSIGFRTVRARTDPHTRLRHILEADLWEISIVTFPMLTGARLSPLRGPGATPAAMEAITRAAAFAASRN
ncbi:HK97 family phage prohead protease [Aquibium microcysteis]|uniref:HK97 family phage prohead protease n=1 Tax=Aquibium microcysteis TaxID=675281 RepID=UPI001EF2C114|nr:HK97 family phage prohead protease [Aquibium microcysteis]